MLRVYEIKAVDCLVQATISQEPLGKVEIWVADPTVQGHPADTAVSRQYRFGGDQRLSRISHSLELDLTPAFSQRGFSHVSYTIIVGISDDGVAASSQNLTSSRNSAGCAIVACGRVRC